ARWPTPVPGNMYKLRSEAKDWRVAAGTAERGIPSSLGRSIGGTMDLLVHRDRSERTMSMSMARLPMMVVPSAAIGPRLWLELRVFLDDCRPEPLQHFL